MEEKLNTKKYQKNLANSGARSAQSARSVTPQLYEIVLTHQAEKIWTCDRTTDRTRCFF